MSVLIKLFKKIISTYLFCFATLKVGNIKELIHFLKIQAFLTKVL